MKPMEKSLQLDEEADLEEARERFIGQWGAMGGSWGINRTMAQIHALLLSKLEPLTTDEVMEELKISRGNANTNLRDLVGWGLVRSQFFKGDRKEYFEAEKDIWKMFCIIARERKRRELEPAVHALQFCRDKTKSLKSEEGAQFHAITRDLENFISKGELVLEKLSESQESTVFSKLVQFFTKR
jgi:DNA-binding transcriptional regulator GbsR (MarR family)